MGRFEAVFREPARLQNHVPGFDRVQVDQFDRDFVIVCVGYEGGYVFWESRSTSLGVEVPDRCV